MIHLRPYQSEMLDTARARMQAGVRNLLLQLPTGGGKTALTAKMFHTAASKGFTCAFGVHRAELIRQSAATFDRVGIRYGIVSPHHPMNSRAHLQILSIPTWRRRMDRLPKFNFIAWDEAHHQAAGTWAAIHAAYPEAYHIGLTATPQRLDGRGLRDFFSEMVQGPSLRWLIAEGYLSPYTYYDAGDEQDDRKLFGDCVRNYLQLAAGKRAIYFCKTVQHSKDTAEAFRQAGVPAAHVDGETDDDERLLALQRFERGEILVLCNVNLFSEGVDVPAVEVVGLARKSESLTWFLQACGRGLRAVYAQGVPLDTAEQRVAAIASGPKPRCLILDHGGNRHLHGLPDADRTWTLDGCESTPGAGAAKRCPRCYAIAPSSANTCPDCGFKWPPMKAKGIEVVDRDLRAVEAEIADLQAQAREERLMSQTVQGLVELGRMRRLKNPEAWAQHTYNLMRQQDKKRRRG